MSEDYAMTPSSSLSSVKHEDDVLTKVKAWLAQGDQLKETLRERRQQLYAELREVEEQLRTLGVNLELEDVVFDKQGNYIPVETEYEEVALDKMKAHQTRLNDEDAIPEEQFRANMQARILKAMEDEGRSITVENLGKRTRIKLKPLRSHLIRLKTDGLVKQGGKGKAYWSLV